MRKKEIHLPKGTFFDIGSLKTGKSACFIKPDGRMFLTSPVIRYHVSAATVVVETKNTVYVG